MLEWLSRNLATVAIGVTLLCVVALIVLKMVYDKKSHKTGCGGGCATCPGAKFCHKNKQTPR